MKNEISDVQRAIRNLAGISLTDQKERSLNHDMSRWLAAGYLVCRDLGYTFSEIATAWNRACQMPFKAIQKHQENPLVVQRVAQIKQELHGGGENVTLKAALDAMRAAEKAILAVMGK